ncbi:MAG: Holliday junction resolvase RuvX [Erysipelotrichaceae bacterium]|nr:Holliday junction resolvase RuvX [Erysipelotrichaceae bacterium]
MGAMLGLDLGTKTLGIAISDDLGIIASGLENFRFEEENYDKAVARVVEIVKEKNITKVVLGKPVHMNGDEGDKVELVNGFKAKLEEHGISVALLDERWTTKMATRRLLEADLSRSKRKKVIDMMSAVIILQNYLDMGGR